MLPEVTDSFTLTSGILISIVIILFLSWFLPMLQLPGPWGVPVLGYYPFLRKDFHIQLHEMTKKYGEVYLINLAGQNFVYLGSLKAIREAHVNKAEFFPSRSHKHSILQASLENGIAYLEGEQWKIHRKFFVQSMREIGINPNKTEMKDCMEQAIHSTLNVLVKSGGNPINMTDLMCKECTNVVLRLILGDAVTENEANKLNEAYHKVLAPMTGMNLLLVGSVAKYLVFPRVPGYYGMLEGTKDMTKLLYKIVEDHKKKFDPNIEPQNFIDMYLRERMLRESKGDPQAKHFTDLALVSSLIQMYGDGSVGIGVFVAGYINALIAHPDVQDAIHEEIVRVVGTERLPTWEDRSNLPLTSSAIKEFVRTAMALLAYGDMECISDTTVLGVKVPKGYITLVNTWAVHNDPDLYENPEKFDATRFLPDKPRVEPPISFGVGKRSCAGEGLVMSEIFLFVASILQNFLLLPESDDKTTNVPDTFDHDEQMDTKLRAVLRPGSKFK